MSIWRTWHANMASKPQPLRSATTPTSRKRFAASSLKTFEFKPPACRLVCRSIGGNLAQPVNQSGASSDSQRFAHSFQYKRRILELHRRVELAGSEDNAGSFVVPMRCERWKQTAPAA